ncbi:(S)-sulfolactate dehydrogenase [Rubricella aquisinus]|uniref:(S)-sulfolactate dehydrogenase n=1 Tax=Rubricella aquisinus TaxID=2028108 RepID=A0A840WNL1_9RHOB|nr:hydroxyacid dehydrogenase [Rubricella aquisinus]MBB5515242.1 (S)-sulfolactate dehydrogenase [Rubricella aquisinus]
MADIVITEFMDEAAVDTLRARFSVHYDPALADDQAAIPGLIGEARALIVRNRTQVRAAVLDAGATLECVGRLGVGLDNIDVEDCKSRGVAVFPATGANDASVAEYVVTTAMMLLRGAYLSTASVAEGAWPRQALIGREIGGTTLGLIGFGAIARETAARFQALGAKVIAYDPFIADDADIWASTGAQAADLDTILSQADVISLHVPLTDDTRNMIDADALARMKSDAILVNAARGGIVDEAALADALRNGALGGAALDVFATEPLDADHGAVFAGLTNILLTPHIAGVTEESNVRVSSLIAETVTRHLAG